MKILVVDDDESQRRLLQRFLVSAGFGVIVCSSREEGLAALEALSAGLGVVTDWCLKEKSPKEYGKDIVERAFELGFGQRVVVRTGTDDETGNLNELKEWCLERGVNLPVLSKELGWGETVDRLRESFEGQVGGSPERGN